MKFSKRSIRELGSMIVGDPDHFRYRSSYYISELFEEAGLPQRHNGQWRPVWAGEIVEEMLASSPMRPNQLPDDFVALLRGVMNKEDAEQDDPDRTLALLALNVPLKREGFEAFYGDDDHLYFKHIGTQTVSAKPDPHKPFTTEEIARREQLSTYLDDCSEDQLIEEVLLPLYRQLGYHRISAAGHEDKNLEHGKDVWMRFMLPSQHMLYFGLQVKKGKLDASADSTKRDGPNTNIAVIHNQVLMMLDSPVWDPEFNSTRLEARSRSPRKTGSLATSHLNSAAASCSWIGTTFSTCSYRPTLSFPLARCLQNPKVRSTIGMMKCHSRGN